MKLRRILFATLAVTATSAQAGDWYALGMVTHANANLNTAAANSALIGAGATGLTSTDKGSSNKWRLQLGYRFNDYFALEGGYIDLGQAKYNASYDSSGSAAGKFRAGGPDLLALGMLPVARNLSLFGELGVVDAKVKSQLAATAPAAAASDKYSKTEVRPIYGVGAQYDLTDQLGLRVSYERVTGLGDKHRLGDMDVDMYSAGIAYRF